jgi:hypothetical protein
MGSLLARAYVGAVALLATVLIQSGCSGPQTSGDERFDPPSVPSEMGSSPPPRKMPSDPSLTVTTQSLTQTPTAVESEIRAAYQRRFEAYWECLRSPAVCDERYLLPASPAALHMAAVRAELVARDRRVGPEPVGYHRIEKVRVAADQRSAEVTACWWSTAILYGAPKYPDQPASSDNPLTLVTSTPHGGRQKDRFTYLNGNWLLVESAGLDDGFEVDPCQG